MKASAGSRRDGGGPSDDVGGNADDGRVRSWSLRRRGRSLFGDRVGQSEVLGVALLFGLTIVGATVVVGFGTTALNDSQARMELESAQHSMTQLDSRASLVALGNSQSQTVTISGGESATTYVDETAGEIRVEVEKSGYGTYVDRTVQLGTVVYERDETTIAYQGGGVWKKDPNGGASMVSPPEFHYRAVGDGEPTLTLPLVQVTEGGSAAGGAESRIKVTQSSPTSSVFPDPSSNQDRFKNPVLNGEVKLTVTSEYADAWAAFFRERTSGSVTRPAPNKVQVELVIPPNPVTVNSALSTGTSSFVAEQGGEVDSYDSRNGPYPGWPANNKAPIGIEGDFTTSNSVVFRGTIEITGDATYSNTVDFYGPTYVGGYSEFSNKPLFDGEYHTGGYFDTDSMNNNGEFRDDVHVGGDFYHSNGDIQGTVYVVGSGSHNPTVHGESYDAVVRAPVDGDVVVDGDVLVEAPVGGNVYAQGDVVVDGADVDGVVHASGVVELKGDLTVGSAGSGTVVWAGEDVRMPQQKTTIDGDAKAYGDADGDGNGIEVATGGNAPEVTGDAYANENIEGDPSQYGSRTQGPGTVSSGPNPPLPVAPTAPSVSFPRVANAQIDQVKDNADSPSENDNAAEDDIVGDGTPGGTDDELSCSSGCELSSGTYLFDDLDVSSTLDVYTSGGDVTIYVEDDFEVTGTINVHGPNRVEVYNDGDFHVDNGEVDVLTDDRAKQFWVFMRSGRPGTNGVSKRTAEIDKGGSLFEGVVYGPPTGPGTQDGVEIRIDQTPVIKGALLGTVPSSTENPALHYDEALADAEALTGTTSAPTVTYLHISYTQIEVESAN